MIKLPQAAFNILVVTSFFITSLSAQNTKKHTEKFSVNEAVNIHVNTTHANVEFETWDKNEVEVVFVMESEENIEELFEKWNFEATGNSDKVNIESESSFDFNMDNFQFDFDFEDFEADMENLNLDLGNLDVQIADFIDDLNLEDIPESPFGKDTNFNGNKYSENPSAYLKKMNEKYGTQVTEEETEKWLEEIDAWSEGLELRIGESKEFDELEERISEKAEEVEKSARKWEIENEGKLREMTQKLEKQLEEINFDQFQNFNHFDQDNSKVKKTIRIKIPKKAKLHLNIRYGEVTLAENLRNINADLNYASLSANTIDGAATDISASFAPVHINHWQNGHLSLNHCNEIFIEKATKIAIDAEGTDIIIGTLLNSGWIKSAYGDLKIKKISADLEKLNLAVNYGSALVYLPGTAIDLEYEGSGRSFLSLPDKCKVLSDTKDRTYRVLRAFNQKQNSGNVFSIKANYGDLTIK